VKTIQIENHTATYQGGMLQLSPELTDAAGYDAPHLAESHRIQVLIADAAKKLAREWACDVTVYAQKGGKTWQVDGVDFEDL